MKNKICGVKGYRNKTIHDAGVLVQFGTNVRKSNEPEVKFVPEIEIPMLLICEKHYKLIQGIGCARVV